MGFNDNIELAKKRVLDSIEFDEFIECLTGSPLYTISGPNRVDGGYSQDYVATMEAIYRIYKEKPELYIDKRMQNDLETFLKKPFITIKIIPVLELLKYHLLREKENEAAFHLDCDKIFQLLSKNVEKNKSKYESARSSQQSESLYEMLKWNDEFLKEKLDNNGFMKS